MQRPSILLRPIHPEPRANHESAEDQFKRECALLELKRQKHAAAMNSLRIASGNASPQEKTQAAQDLRQWQQAQLNEREKRKAHERHVEQMEAKTRREIDEAEAAAEALKERERRLRLREVAASNQRLAEEKRRQEAEDHKRAIELENRNLAYTLSRSQF